MKDQHQETWTVLRHLKATASILAITSVAFGGISASAQAVSEDTDDEIIVLGQRQALASAVERKRNADTIVDSIVALDIGKLPDLNVAEALQRISGVQITRNRGEGSGIAIRGLTQVRTELNGRDSFSTTDGRALSFEDVPAELLAGIDVYKNPSANLIEGGIGGTVDLRTRMPFDSNERIISGAVSATRYDLRDKTGYSLSGLYSDRWDTSSGEIGLLVNLSVNDAVFREDAIIVEPFFTRTDIPGFLGQEVEVASGAGISSWNGDRKRIGGSAILQWAPSTDTEIYASYLTSHYDFYDPQTGIFAYGAGEGGSLTPVPGSFSFDSAGNLQTGGFQNPPFQSFTRDATRDSQTTDYAVGFKHNISDRVRVSADAQYIDSTSEYLDVTGFGTVFSGASVFLDLTGDAPEISVSPDGFLDDPNNYQYQALMDRNAYNDGNEIALRSDLEWDFDNGGAIKSFTAGARYTNKDVKTSDSGFNWAAISGPPWDGSDIASADYSEFPDYYAPDPHQSSFWRGDRAQSAFGSHFVVDPALMANQAQALRTLSGLNPLAGAQSEFSPQNQINTQEESTYAAYAMVNFKVENSLPFDGNLGVRIVKTDVGASGQRTLTYRVAADPSTDVQVQDDITVDQSYTEVLPSLNVRFFLKEDLFLRFAGSRGLARPSFGDLSANFTIGENYVDDDGDPTTAPVLFDRTGSGGNPGLRPLTADQFDVALEYYFNEGDMVYGTVFHKSVHNFKQSGLYDADFDIPGKGLQSFEISAPVNGDNGTIKGFEVGTQLFFDKLPAPFNGFGVQANYTYVDSEAPSPSATDTAGNPLIVPLEGLSKHSYNLVGLYEKGPFSARLAYNWRDAWVITTSGNGTGSLPIYNDSFGQMDGSINYDVNENVSLSIDAVNILNTVKKTYQAFPNRPRDYVMNDRRIGVRLRAKF